MRSDQVDQGFIQTGLENLQGWRLQSLHKQPAPALLSSPQENSSLKPLKLEMEFLISVMGPSVFTELNLKCNAICFNKIPNHGVQKVETSPLS